MVTVKCAVCGDEFEAQRSTAKFCSNKCKQRNKNKSFQKKTCIICGKQFKGHNNKKYCSDECAEIAQINDQMNRSFTENSYFDAAQSDEYDPDFFDGVEYGDLP